MVPGRPQDDRDLLGRDPVSHQPEDLGAELLGLGPLAARLEQPDGLPRRHAGRLRLEQRALEVVERRRLVLRIGRQVDDAVGRRPEVLGQPGPVGEGGPPGLVGERDPHLDAGGAGQRLDGVPLRGGQVLEAVEEDRGAAPASGIGAQPVERAPRAAVPVHAPEPLEPRACRPRGSTPPRGRARRGVPGGRPRRRRPGAGAGARPARGRAPPRGAPRRRGSRARGRSGPAPADRRRGSPPRRRAPAARGRSRARACRRDGRARARRSRSSRPGPRSARRPP